jgi:hypothetical protein
MQNNPKPDLKLILRPKEDFRDIFQPGQPGWLGPCNQRLSIRIETRYFNTTVAINTQYIVIVFVLKLPFPGALSTIRNIIALNG